jgi:dihydropteroate synthase
MGAILAIERIVGLTLPIQPSDASRGPVNPPKAGAVERTDVTRPALMGIVNVTPDSFFDGGRFTDPSAAAAQVERLVAEGAEIVDIGGESSRPGSLPVSAEVQIERITAAVRAALGAGARVSIDTTSPIVARTMLKLGAHIINDVSCLREPDLAAVVAEYGASLILMHSRGSMTDMKGYSEYPDDAYGDVVVDVLSEWRAARDRAVERGLSRERIWLDPGLGFAKNARHSFELLSRLAELANEGVPLVVGPSRKSFISAASAARPDERLGGTIAACLIAADAGTSVLRVHDVLAVRQALAVARTVRSAPREALR